MAIKRVHRLNVVIDDDEQQKIRKLAEAERVSISDYIRLAVWRDYTNKFDPGDECGPGIYGVVAKNQKDARALYRGSKAIGLTVSDLAQLFAVPVAEVKALAEQKQTVELIDELKKRSDERIEKRVAAVLTRTAKKAKRARRGKPKRK